MILKIGMKIIVRLLTLILVLSACNSVEQGNPFELEDNLGTIVNRKWSDYIYKSHFKKMPLRDENIDMYSRLVKNETGEFYVHTNDVYVRNDTVIWQGYNMPFNYDEFLKLDSLLLSNNPIEVTGDFVPEDQFMNRIYYFNSLYVQIEKSPGNYHVFFFSVDY